MMSCLRTSSDGDDENQQNMPPLLVRATTNPYGAGRSAVKRYFIDQAKAGQVFEKLEEHDGEIFKSQRMHIFGSFKENIKVSINFILL